MATTTAENLEAGLKHQVAGQTTEAEKIYREILATEPANAEALHRLGLLTLWTGRQTEARELIERAVAADGKDWRFACGLGLVLSAMGRQDDAIAAFQNAKNLNPKASEIYAGWGTALQTKGDIAEAIKLYRQALELNPNHVEAINNLGNALAGEGRTDEALEIYRRGLAIAPRHTVMLNNMGTAMESQRRWKEAIEAFHRAVEIQPEFAEAWYNLGKVLHGAGELQKSRNAYSRALELRPEYIEALINLGNVLCMLGQHKAGADSYVKALAIKPDVLDAYINLGAVLRVLWKVDEAVVSLRQALALRPDSNVAYCNLGNVLKDIGNLDEAIDSYRRAAELNTQDVISHSNLLFSLHYHPKYDSRAMLHESLKWNVLHGRRVNDQIRPHDNDRSRDRRLRIGYVSPDFKTHCQSFFTVPLLSNHDHTRFEIILYANVINGGERTEQLKSYADQWRVTAGLNDDEVAEMVRKDQVDILVDLTMHMANGRPLLFARKPAPVQVAWLAYPGTTGIAAIDYRLTDPYLDPPGDSDLSYSEKSIRLPDTFWCYDPLDREPPVNALPALTAGHVTFGCLNNFCKVTDPALLLWGKVMAAVPGSRLVLLSPVGAHRQRVYERLGEFGVEPGRVEFVTYQQRLAYLETYHRIDLGLDTIPYNGHTTSLDSYWMGVPVVTRVGNTVVGRAGWSQLNNLKLSELAAESDDQFVEIVKSLTSNLGRLSTLRASLRERLRQSPLMDGARFARNMEAAFRGMWKQWCETGERADLIKS